MILAVCHFATNRVTIYMHIQRAHKDGDLQPAIGKIFISLYFFNGYNFSIGRSNDGVIVNRVVALWDAEKRNNKDKQDEGSKKNNPAYNRRRKTENIE